MTKKGVRYTITADGRCVEQTCPAPVFKEVEPSKVLAITPLDLCHPSGRPIGNYL